MKRLAFAIGALVLTAVLLITFGRPGPSLQYSQRQPIDASGFMKIWSIIDVWPRGSELPEIASRFKGLGVKTRDKIDHYLVSANPTIRDRVNALIDKAAMFNFDGDPKNAFATLLEARALAKKDANAAEQLLYTIIHLQGITALRMGENENCIMCRGESSCILPISRAAMHTNPEGSRLAIKYFTEYLDRFPDDLEAKWLLNVAHMTLGEHPEKVNRKYLVNIDHFLDSSHSIGKFRDIGAVVGVDRYNQAGGGIMEDFDNDGLLDIVTTCFDPLVAMGLYRNTGQGKFENITETAGITGQLGGLNCMQTDYDNDGNMDVFIVRGAWFPDTMSMRPTLLKNNGDRTFTDVTSTAGLLEPVNSIAAGWADYDNDGWLDLFVCCESQRNRLYHNLKDGTFEEVAETAGLKGNSSFLGKGAAWIDIDNDGYQDLFVNNYSDVGGQLYLNNRNGTFRNGSTRFGIDGPRYGFSCWSWDYNNDGWLDIFATCYDRTLEAGVQGLMGVPHKLNSNRLFRNRQGQGFDDVTQEAGLDSVFITMGSNFGDLDNDGYLDMYLGTGEPNISTLVPNRMLKNINGERFADITASSGTGNLQKGHGVAIGDWDRDGNVDIFIEMGGAINGDKYHNILFQNPGHDNSWITVKLRGEKSNRAAIGARIKVRLADSDSKTIYRTITSGSSFGANPLEQTIGLGKASQIESLEVYWPTSNTTQLFRNVPIGQSIEITEFSDQFRILEQPKIVWDK